MELMSGYGSDSDEEPTTTLPPAKIAKTSNEKPAPQTISGGEKTKKLNINILPPEIQQALQNGDDFSDSDDEADVFNSRGSKKPVKDSKPLPAAHKREIDLSAPKSGLLAFLPKPTQALEGETTMKTAPVSLKPTQTTTTSMKPHSFSFQTTSTTTKVSKSGGQPAASETDKSSSKPQVSYNDLVNAYGGKDDASDDDSDDDDDNGRPNESNALNPVPLFTFHAPTSSSASSSSSSSSSSSTAFHATTEELYGPSRPANFVSSTATTIPDIHAPPLPVADSQLYMMEESDTNTYSSSSAGSNYHTMTAAQKRKRERDIELALQAGDLSAVEQLGGPIDVVASTVPDRWDAKAYQGEKETELKIHALASSVGLKNGITKQANRKHQINTLAVQAAKMELQLLEAQGTRNMTKYETQRKYGWN